MLGQRRRRWTSFKPTLLQCLVLGGVAVTYACIYHFPLASLTRLHTAGAWPYRVLQSVILAILGVILGVCLKIKPFHGCFRFINMS